jgi:hypothetical protein
LMTNMVAAVTPRMPMTVIATSGHPLPCRRSRTEIRLWTRPRHPDPRRAPVVMLLPQLDAFFAELLRLADGAATASTSLQPGALQRKGAMRGGQDRCLGQPA